MASEYLMWLARNEKPEEKRELTPQEKRRNWWEYHKWYVVAGIAALFAVAFFVWDIAQNAKNTPDYQIAYVGKTFLNDETITALQDAFAELGEDLNGDGQVLVRCNQYNLDPDSVDMYTTMAASTQLLADFSQGTSFYYMVLDPEAFQSEYNLLAQHDGTSPAEGTDAAGLCIPLEEYLDIEGLTGFYLGHRAYDADDASEFSLWENLVNQAK